jgi:hypothetical protein
MSIKNNLRYTSLFLFLNNTLQTNAPTVDPESDSIVLMKALVYLVLPKLASAPLKDGQYIHKKRVPNIEVTSEK